MVPGFTDFRGRGRVQGVEGVTGSWGFSGSVFLFFCFFVVSGFEFMGLQGLGF